MYIIDVSSPGYQKLSKEEKQNLGARYCTIQENDDGSITLQNYNVINGILGHNNGSSVYLLMSDKLLERFSGIKEKIDDDLFKITKGKDGSYNIAAHGTGPTAKKFD